mmetsp:Transcript_6484/g.14897  ORF Transcript_6484/g.14897 Transcript_6484/m.14897 type:complete len:378 (+) Transcript_6484:25-1158(+)
MRCVGFLFAAFLNSAEALSAVLPTVPDKSVWELEGSRTMILLFDEQGVRTFHRSLSENRQNWLNEVLLDGQVYSYQTPNMGALQSHYSARALDECAGVLDCEAQAEKHAIEGDFVETHRDYTYGCTVKRAERGVQLSAPIRNSAVLMKDRGDGSGLWSLGEQQDALLETDEHGMPVAFRDSLGSWRLAVYSVGTVDEEVHGKFFLAVCDPGASEEARVWPPILAPLKGGGDMEAGQAVPARGLFSFPGTEWCGPTACGTTNTINSPMEGCCYQHGHGGPDISSSVKPCGVDYELYQCVDGKDGPPGLRTAIKTFFGDDFFAWPCKEWTKQCKNRNWYFACTSYEWNWENRYYDKYSADYGPFELGTYRSSGNWPLDC